MRSSRRRDAKLGITFRVGAPPPTPRPPRPVWVWQTALLGVLVVVECIAIWVGGRTATQQSPASTVTTASTHSSP